METQETNVHGEKWKATRREMGLVATHLELSLMIINFNIKHLTVFTILAVN
jgi:hypothetical protein